MIDQKRQSLSFPRADGVRWKRGSGRPPPPQAPTASPRSTPISSPH